MRRLKTSKWVVKASSSTQMKQHAKTIVESFMVVRPSIGV
jgi:hypothetical protein